MVEGMTKTLRGLSLLIALIVPRSASYAHQLDEYVQATLVQIDPSAIRLQINLTPGVEVADEVLDLVDHDRDGVISQKEAVAYAEMLKRDLAVRLDGSDVELSVTESNIVEPSELRTGWGIIQTEFLLAPAALTAGAHTLVFENRHLGSLSVYSFNAARPRSDSIQIIRQTRSDNQGAGEIEFAYDAPASPSKTGIVAALAAFVIAVVASVLRLARSRRH